MTSPENLCNTRDHQVSRRQLLGTATGIVGAGGLGGLLEPVFAEEMKKLKEQDVLNEAQAVFPNTTVVRDFDRIKVVKEK